LNRDSSATSRTLPQWGHFGRLKLSAPSKGSDGAWHADSIISILLWNLPHPIGASLRALDGSAASGS
jgi:hypothetical protein